MSSQSTSTSTTTTTTTTATAAARSALAARAERFRELNLAGRFVLPNAWDAVSARIFEQAGFPAIATTSAGVAFTRGQRDAEQIDRDVMFHELGVIAAAVGVPVSADIESGYGPTPAHVAASVTAVLDLGIVGVNLEDRTHAAGDTPLHTIDAQKARLAAAREAAARAGVPLVINARTDIFLLGLGTDVDDRVGLAIARGKAYLEAGADLIFVPGVVDPAIVRRLADGIGGPISLMAGPGAPPADALFAAGAHRVSLGPSAMLATLGLLRTIATDIRTTGTWTTLTRDDFYSYQDLDALLTR